jgi:hypothetical protein
LLIREFFIYERHFTSVAFLRGAAKDRQFHYSALLIDKPPVKVASFSHFARPMA